MYLEWVKVLAARTHRIASVCVGAHLLAAAGPLDGKRATTHWSIAQRLAADHPAVKVAADPIFIREDNVWTGAGMTPHASIESGRVEKARQEMESSDASLERIASVCGFGTTDTLVRAFRRRLNTTPTEYRRRFRVPPAP